MKKCHDLYLEDDRELKCTHGKKSHLTALLLSIFLSFTGAANFYIEEHGLASAQLFFGVVSIISLLLNIIKCYKYCKFKCTDKSEVPVQAFDQEDSKICKRCTKFWICVGVVFILINSIWWIVDIVLFAVNIRKDINGCLLYQS